MMTMNQFPRRTQQAIIRFFKNNPGEDAAFPCGHDDFCFYIATRDEATPRQPTRENPDAACPGCGGHIDRERYIYREFVQEKPDDNKTTQSTA